MSPDTKPQPYLMPTQLTPPLLTPTLLTPALIATCTLILSGCANQPEGGHIIIDKKHVDMQAYREDLRECQRYASEVNTGATVAKSAGTAAVVSGAIGAIFGNSHTAAKSAGAGAVAGTAKGVSAVSREKQQVVKSCLRGRGYRILN